MLKLADIFGWDSDKTQTDHHIILSKNLLIFGILLTLALKAQYQVVHTKSLQWIPENAPTLLLGIIVSAILKYTGGYDHTESGGQIGNLAFNSSIFFFVLLPPILFNSGYHLKRRLFHANLAGIIGLSIFGTLISVVIIAAGIFLLGQYKLIRQSLSIAECLAFASFISSTDPVAILSVFSALKVEATLFYLVFGESVLNDAVCVTLFRIASNLVGETINTSKVSMAFIQFAAVFVGSALIGYTLSLCSAFIFKLFDFTHDKVTLIGIFVMIVYIPFMLSEMLQMSGIVTILFTGMAARRYVNKNIPLNAKRMSSFVFMLMAHLAETSVFLSLGLSVFAQTNFDSIQYDFIGWTLLLALIGRIVNVYPVLTMVNCFHGNRNKSHDCSPKISNNTKHMIVFAGLRGAVAYSCANIFPDKLGNRDMINATTTAVVLFTNLCMGFFLVPVLHLLNIRTNVDNTQLLRDLQFKDRKERTESLEKRYVYPLVLKSGWSTTNMQSTNQFETCFSEEDWEHNSSGGGTVGNAYNSSHGIEIETFITSSNPIRSTSPLPSAPPLLAVTTSNNMENPSTKENYRF